MSAFSAPEPHSTALAGKRVLWIRYGCCLPARDGAKIYTFNLLTQLMKTCEVQMLELHRQDRTEAEACPPYAHGIERVHADLTIGGASGKLFKLAYLVVQNLVASREPFLHAMFHRKEYVLKVMELDQSGRFDLIIADNLMIASLFAGWKQPRKTPALLLQHNVEAFIWKRLASQHRNPFTRLFFHEMARRMQRCEPVLCRLFDGVTAISEQDAAYHREVYGLSNILGCLPPGATPNPQGPPPAVVNPASPPRIALVGSLHWLPNLDALFWFVREIYPLIQQSLPGVLLRIIGSNPPESVIRLGAENSSIEVTGTVEQVAPLLRECALLVVPLRAGGGVRLKILEAMAAGVPIVSTTVGAEGLRLQADRELLLADDPEAFSQAVLRLLQDSSLRKTIAENALNRAIREFSWQQSGEKLSSFAAAVLDKR